MTRAILIGNYGIGNFGDDALRAYFTTRFPGTQWTVLVGATPGAGESSRLPFGFRSLFHPWWKTISAFRTADVAVFGGGTLFTDIESVRACLLWGLHALVCRLTGTPYILAAQGIGPFKTKLGERIARAVVRHAASISVRDSESEKRIASWPKNTEVVRVFDPVFALLQEQKITTNPKNVLIVIPRLNSGESFLNTVREELKVSAVNAVRIVSLEDGHPEEQARCRELEVVVREQGLPVSVFPLRSLSEVPAAFSGASLVLTQRYHGAIIALGLGLPFQGVRQAAGDKIEALAQEGKDPSVLLQRIDALETELTRFLKR